MWPLRCGLCWLHILPLIPANWGTQKHKFIHRPALSKNMSFVPLFPCSLGPLLPWSLVSLLPCYSVPLFSCSFVPLLPCYPVFLFPVLCFLSLFPFFPVPLFSCSFVPFSPVLLFPVPCSFVSLACSLVFLFPCSLVPLFPSPPPFFLFPVPCSFLSLACSLFFLFPCSLVLLFPCLRADDWKFTRHTVSDLSQNEEPYRTENLYLLSADSHHTLPSLSENFWNMAACIGERMLFVW